jgi:hypothetical protein
MGISFRFFWDVLILLHLAVLTLNAAFLKSHLFDIIDLSNEVSNSELKDLVKEVSSWME